MVMLVNMKLLKLDIYCIGLAHLQRYITCDVKFVERENNDERPND